MSKKIPVWLEIRRILLLAIPVAIAQLLTAAAGFVDTLMAGQAGVNDLAGVSIGSAIWLTLGIGVMGLLMSVNPIVAQYVAAKRRDQVQIFMHQVVRVSLLLSLAIFIVIRVNDWYLPFFISDTEVLRITVGYLDGFSWGVPAFVGMLLLRSYSEGLSFTKPHLYASILSLVVNVVANYALIFGHFGAPELGGIGAGWATAIAFWASFIAMLIYSKKHPNYLIASIWSKWQPYDRSECLHFLKVGTPIAFTLFIEVSIFSVIALFLGSRSSVEIAANQIAMNVSYLAFTIPVSFSVATTIRVASEVGAGRYSQARRIAFIGVGLALMGAMLNTTGLVFFNTQIVDLYSNDAQVMSLATQLILFAAVFQIIDAFVVPTQGALRGYKDTRMPLLIAIMSYWVITIPLGYSLGLTQVFGEPKGAEGFWIALVVGLFINGVFMTRRLWTVSHRYL